MDAYAEGYADAALRLVEDADNHELVPRAVYDNSRWGAALVNAMGYNWLDKYRGELSRADWLDEYERGARAGVADFFKGREG